MWKKILALIGVFAAFTVSIAPMIIYNNGDFLQYADYLASKSIITKQTKEFGYRLNQKITRAEIAKIAANLAKLQINTCSGTVYKDVSSELEDLC